MMTRPAHKNTENPPGQIVGEIPDELIYRGVTVYVRHNPFPDMRPQKEIIENYEDGKK